jgi:hypothetical protein
MIHDLDFVLEYLHINVINLKIVLHRYPKTHVSLGAKGDATLVILTQLGVNFEN